jgi:hypothetical protein
MFTAGGSLGRVRSSLKVAKKLKKACQLGAAVRGNQVNLRPLMEMDTEMSSLARKLENAKMNDAVLTTTNATAEQLVIDVLTASLAKVSEAAGN